MFKRLIKNEHVKNALKALFWWICCFLLMLLLGYFNNMFVEKCASLFSCILARVVLAILIIFILIAGYLFCVFAVKFHKIWFE